MRRFLVLGSGGREHALCWRLAHEAEVHCTPGNPGIADDVPCYGIPLHDVEGIIHLSKRLAPVTIVIGPEDPLISGLADNLRAAGFSVFGPGALGAQLEASKSFSKDLMKKHNVPTAHFETFIEVNAALECAKKKTAERGGVVVKASGNALGKGAVVCQSFAEAEEALTQFLVEKTLGEAGTTVVVEDLLKGPEFSLLTLVNGYEIYSLPIAQDYKRAIDGDQGPNTGGMGS